MTNTPWPHFSESELRCHCGCGRQDMDADFLLKLEALRMAYGKPMPVSSGYRCPAHNAATSTTGENGPHTTGQAIDILVAGEDAYRLVGLAIQYGFTGIGFSQKGPPEKRFIHLDTLTRADGYPRPTVWTY
ncbi:MAG: DUF882 domain-containing protein [Magnetococcales bacterium]|nr:DUF882 domain-containing protein [Magnetococcales bacterium]MBF0116909.1 DUF882 domain-containing protein [Magnetococcales bacterium]